MLIQKHFSIGQGALKIIRRECVKINNDIISDSSIVSYKPNSFLLTLEMLNYANYDAACCYDYVNIFPINCSNVTIT